MAKTKAIPSPVKSSSMGDTDLEQKKKRILDVISEIEREYGTGSVFHGNNVKIDVKTLTTGSLALDIASGVGGIPYGRIIEVYGAESSGKTTITLNLIAQAQALGMSCAFIDMEQALDPSWARRIGVNMDDLLISQPESGEQALAIAEKLVLSGQFTIVAIDSVAALTPRAEIEGQMGDSHVGLQARLMNQALRKLTSQVKTTNTILLFTNQIRDTIGGMGYGPQTTTPGGKALKFYATMRLEAKRIQTLKVGEVAYGNLVKVEFKKNKVAAPFTKAEITIRFDRGLSLLDEIVDFATAEKIIEKRGAYYRYNETMLGQGKDKTIDFLSKNTDVTFEIHRLVCHALGQPELKVKPNYNKNASNEDNLEIAFAAKKYGDDPVPMLDQPVNLDEDEDFSEFDTEADIE
jgi:recombination protein RecA